MVIKSRKRLMRKKKSLIKQIKKLTKRLKRVKRKRKYRRKSRRKVRVGGKKHPICRNKKLCKLCSTYKGGRRETEVDVTGRLAGGGWTPTSSNKYKNSNTQDLPAYGCTITGESTQETLEERGGNNPLTGGGSIRRKQKKYRGGNHLIGSDISDLEKVLYSRVPEMNRISWPEESSN